MEHLCYFVNSRGLLKSCNFHSNNPKSSCNNDTQYLLNMLKSNKMFNRMSIYVCSDLLQFFVLQILPKLKYSFILVSGDSDMCVPKEALSNILFNKLINSQLLIKWFIQNTQIQNMKKIIQLPIGLDYHTISNNSNHIWKTDGENHLPKFQEKILLDIKNNSKPFQERIPKIYINFSINNDRFKQREKAFKEIPNDLLVINNEFTKRTQNWKNMSQYTFVLSPFGIGMDCHRTWEALCLGCIPIICAPNFKELFKDLPLLIVNNWTDITERLLKETIYNFSQQTANYNKLTLNFWSKQFI